MSGSKKQFVPHEQAQITSVKMAGETALSEMMGTWKRLFKNELAALGEEKLAKPVTRTYRLKKLLPVMEAESVGSLAGRWRTSRWPSKPATGHSPSSRPSW